MSKEIKNTIQRVIDAGEKAVEELIKVAHDEIITDDPSEDLAADRLKNAAATKKLAIFDAFEILSRLETEKDKLSGKEESSEGSGKDTGFQSFAESKGRKL
ncbi:MAG: hypothetical protein CBD14_00045 [Proteobacteria bacterium TMED154]|nr:MAG: hypothetical protein CBD14_00045 [Proteobacteria bacterium TMED154]|tara:strand:- start:11159 stop:11461 length:303 start_codon:yes stop_codon:yes gene_type:complete